MRGTDRCRYVALEGRRALHMKGTLVRQAAESSYKLTEARLGGRLTRQDINIEQVPVLAPCLYIQVCISGLRWCSRCMVTVELCMVQSTPCSTLATAVNQSTLRCFCDFHCTTPSRGPMLRPGSTWQYIRCLSPCR